MDILQAQQRERQALDPEAAAGAGDRPVAVIQGEEDLDSAIELDGY